MEIKAKFKLLGIFPRNRIIQFFVSKTHVAWVILDDGNCMPVNVVTPIYHEQKQYLELVAAVIKEKLVDTLRFRIDVERHRLETSEHYIDRMRVREKSYCLRV
jgi:hypothetical protein